MTQVVPLLQDEDNSNVYNRNKGYHVADQEAPQNADELFRPIIKKPEVVPPNDEDGALGNKDNHDYEKRWKNLKKTYDTEISKTRKKIEELEARLEQASQVPKTPENIEELEKWKQENKDLYQVVEKLTKLQVQDGTKAVTEKLTELEQREQKLARAQALKEVRDYHKDFDEIVNSEEFHDWAESQSEEVQTWIYKNPSDSRKTINALNLYKFDVKSKQPVNESAKANQRNLEDAASMVSVKSSSEPNHQEKKIWSKKEIQKLSMDEYDKLEKEIDQAIREGRVRD